MSESDPPLLTPRKLVEGLASRKGVSPEALLLPATAILTPVYPLFKRLTTLFNGEPLEAWSWKSPPFYRFAMGREDTDTGVLVCCSMGAPNVAVALEELGAFGVRTAFFLGLAGAVGKRFVPGDLIIPPYAHVGEGVSRYYGNQPLSFPDGRLLECVMEAFGKKRGVFQTPVFTTDALYRETRELILKVSSRGAGVIDMETSAFFSVSRKVSLRGAALLWVTDVLTEDGWEPHFFDKRVKWSLETRFRSFRKWLMKAGCVR